MTILTNLVILLILLTLGAFFSAAETAMTALSAVDIAALKEQGRRGQRIAQLLQQPQRLLTCLLIGNNIANISASAITAYLAGLYLGGIFVALATFVLAAIIIFFCEIVPKQLALLDKRKVALRLVWPAVFFYALFSPLLLLTLKLAALIPGLRQQGNAENLEESLEHIVDLATEKDFISDYERDFIRNVLDLNDKTARQIMTHRKEIFSVGQSTLVAQVYPEIIAHGYSRIPVYRHSPENICGILYATEIHQAQLASPSGMTVAELMKPVSFLPHTVRVSELFFHFKQHDGNLAILLDEQGGLAGVVSQEDVLEAVFGKLYDEDEKEEQATLDIRRQDDSYVFSGMLGIRQFEQRFHLQLEEDLRLATMSGYLCDVVGSIPEQGQQITTAEGSFWVLEGDGQRIVTLRFRPLVPVAEE